MEFHYFCEVGEEVGHAVIAGISVILMPNALFYQLLVQRRRAFPTQVIQRMQVIVQNKLLSPALASRERPKPPFVMRLIQWFPALRRIPARLVGLGVRPEHIQTPERA